MYNCTINKHIRVLVGLIRTPTQSQFRPIWTPMLFPVGPIRTPMHSQKESFGPVFPCRPHSEPFAVPLRPIWILVQVFVRQSRTPCIPSEAHVGPPWYANTCIDTFANTHMHTNIYMFVWFASYDIFLSSLSSQAFMNGHVTRSSQETKPKREHAQTKTKAKAKWDRKRQMQTKTGREKGLYTATHPPTSGSKLEILTFYVKFRWCVMKLKSLTVYVKRWRCPEEFDNHGVLR